VTWIPPLLVALPLLSAAAIAGGDHFTPEPVQKGMGIACAGAVTVFAVLLMLRSQTHDVLHWFGGWQPRHGVALGIDFAVDPLAAGMCVVISGVVLIALVYSATYLKTAARLYDSLLLTALAAMCGFAMAGDIFNMFVWLELIGVAAYALTGFKADQLGPLQGAVNFSIVNTIGGYLFAIGLALLYARSGALNLAQIGQAVARHGGGLVVVAMTLVFAGLLTKGAAVPFHFWAADAYAVAPAPVCAIFGAVMTDIGLIGVARLYWTVFQPAFADHARAIGDLLLWVGIVTGLLAGAMALLQRHLKRMIAYSVLCHIGIMLAGIGLLASKGLAGTATMFVAHACLTAALFFISGVLLTEHGTIDELKLRGRARGEPLLAVLWFASALGLIGAPYVGVYVGHGLIDDAAALIGRQWVQPLTWLAGALAGAALLRAGARVFLGIGRTHSPLLGKELEEEPIERQPLRPLLTACAAAAAAAGLVVSVAPGLGQRAEQAAGRFRDRTAYVSVVLHARVESAPRRLPYALEPTSTESLAYGAGAVVLALSIAGVGLAGVRGRGRRFLEPPVDALKALHSGLVGDYVVWLTVGTAVFGGVWAVTLR